MRRSLFSAGMFTRENAIAHLLLGVMRRKRRRSACSRSALLETLEDRTLLTTFLVNTPLDTPAEAAGTSDGLVSLREAVTAANQNSAFGDAAAGSSSGDIIRFDANVFGSGMGQVQLIGLNQGQLSVMDDLRIDGQGLGVIISGQGMSRVIDINAGSSEGVTISGLTLTRGNSGMQPGGALRIAGGAGVSLINANITNSTATSGGGVALNNSTLFTANTSFSGNTAMEDGGAILNTGGILKLGGGKVSGNLAQTSGGGVAANGGTTIFDQGVEVMGNRANGAAAMDGGGAVYSSGRLAIRDAKLMNNSAAGTSGSGGGVFSADGYVTVERSTISANVANRAGGGIEIVNGALVMTQSTLGGSSSAMGNTAGPAISANPGNGGGLHISGMASVQISGGLVGFNYANSEGGGLWNQAGARMTLRDGVLVADNVAAGNDGDNGGAGIFNNGGTLQILNSTLRANRAIGTAGSGGGILSADGTVIVQNSTILANKANRAGGGIEVITGTVGLVNTVLGGKTASAGNIAGPMGSASPGNGGGLHVSADARVVVTGGSVQNNVAANEGGGLWNSDSGFLLVQDGVSIRDNVAQGNAADNGGGGLFNDGGRLAVQNSLITGNRAAGTSGSGGGIFAADGLTTLVNTVVQSNTANRAGGGIEVVSGSVELINSTLGGVQMGSGNVAGPAGSASPGNGGGLHVSADATVILNGGIVQNNIAAREGGGLWNSGSGLLVVRNGAAINNNVARGDAADDGGGGIFNNGGRLAILDATISRNVASGESGSGGGIFSTSGLVTAINTTITANSANRAGGGVELIGGSMETLNTDIGGAMPSLGNIAGPMGTANPGNGGGLHVSDDATLILNGGVVQNNVAASEGGGLWNSGTGLLVVRNGTLIANNVARGAAADNGGGGVFNNGGRVTIQNATIRGNLANGVAGSGGGILSTDGMVTLANSSIVGNSANRAGGGIEVIDGDLRLMNSSLGGSQAQDGNTAGPMGSANPGNGGGLHVTGTASTTLMGGVVSNNVAGSQGGGLWNQSGAEMTLDGVVVSQNTANGDTFSLFSEGGGGIYNNGGNLNVMATTVAQNTATGNSANGGGIFSSGGTVVINGSTVHDNRTTGGSSYGGGIFLNAGNTAFLTNSTIARNQTEFYGGGLVNSGDLTITNSTIAQNQADPSGTNGGGFGGGIADLVGSTTLMNNSIVAGNLSDGGSMDDDVQAMLDASSSNNLIGNAASAGGLMDGTNGNIVGMGGMGTRALNTILNPILTNTGGPTLTYQLVTGSAALNSGSNALAVDNMSNMLMFDQRGAGFLRVKGGTVDMGAYEA